MKIAYRILLGLSAGFLGLAATTYWAAQTRVPDGSGLAGPAIALGWGLGGALVAIVVAVVVGLRLSDGTLARTAFTTFLVALSLAAVLYVKFQQQQVADRDDESAYSGIADYEFTLERIGHSDPYLSPRTALYASTHRWEKDLPDGRTCSGKMKADAQRAVAEKLTEFATIATGELTGCGLEATGEQLQFTWAIRGVDGLQQPTGSERFAQSCIDSNAVLSSLLRSAEMATVSSNGKIRCK